MAVLTIDGTTNTHQQPYLFPAPAFTAGSVIGGNQLPAPIVGSTVVNHALRIIDPTPASSGFLPPPGNPTQKATFSKSQAQQNGISSLNPYLEFLAYFLRKIFGHKKVGLVNYQFGKRS